MRAKLFRLPRAADATGAFIENHHYGAALVLVESDSFAGSIAQVPGRSRRPRARRRFAVAVGRRSLGRRGLRRRPGPGLRRLLVAVIFIAQLRDTVAGANRHVHALAVSIGIGELAIQVFGIGWIAVA